MMRKLLFTFILFWATLIASAQFGAEPVKWKFEIVDKGLGDVEFVATANIEPGWHMYDVNIPPGGPNPTSLEVDNIEGAKLIGKFQPVNSKLISGFDDLFQMTIGYYDTKATFVQKLKVTDAKSFVFEGDVRSQACNDEECTPPLPVSFKFGTKSLNKSSNITSASVLEKVEQKVEEKNKISTETKNIPTKEDKVKKADTLKTIIASTPLVPASSTSEVIKETDLWKPVIDELSVYGAAGAVNSNDSMIWLFILGMGGGLLALMTPCVWPLIPMTVSFFLKRNKKDKKKAFADALTYGIGIIIIYVGLGLLITALFGASALNDLSTSAIFNIIFGLLLIFFAASFLGAFEIVLPASWSNKIDSKAESTTGFLSIFFMAFTLALVSFSCTGPVIGTVLVQAANTGEMLAPTIVMFGFALALAIPFSLFALFPSWLNSMPKSGGWLNSVKVVLGFLELALALKFFSVADMAYGWRLLDREVFLVLWIVIFALLGFYLLGKLRFKHDDPVESLSVSRFFLAIIPLAFAIYLVPGLWGAPLRTISAFSPPILTQDFNLYDGSVHAKFDDYDAGMEYAKKVGKPVLLDFSGWGCVNCRKMEANVWVDPRVKKIIEDDYVLITLMVDDKTRLAEPYTVVENGRETKIKTIGDKWSYFQRHKFGTNSQPYYIPLNDQGKPVGYSYAFDENINKYLDFLNTGLKNFKDGK